MESDKGSTQRQAREHAGADKGGHFKVTGTYHKFPSVLSALATTNVLFLFKCPIGRDFTSLKKR